MWVLIVCRILLKLWATPPASKAMASIF